MEGRLLNLGPVFGSAGAAVASTAASICCIGPIGIALLGVNGAILAASIKPYGVYILGASLALLAFAHWSVRRRNRSAEGTTCSVRAGRATRLILWIATVMWFAAVAIQFAADRYWL
jgi:hypothetical protein